jgi:RHS repeat-associated protein
VFNLAGEKVWEAILDSRGKIRMLEGHATTCPFRYQGQYEDAETVLYYNRFRYYDPEEGVYVSQDPIGLEGGSKTYSYVTDTNTWVDPLGLKPCYSNDATKSFAENIITKHGGEFVKEGYYKFPTRRAARRVK